MGQKITYTEVKAQQIEHWEPKDNLVITGISLDEIDECINNIFPDEIPTKMKDSLVKKMKVCKFAKKIFK